MVFLGGLQQAGTLLVRFCVLISDPINIPLHFLRYLVFGKAQTPNGGAFYFCPQRALGKKCHTSLLKCSPGCVRAEIVLQGLVSIALLT